MNQTPQPLICPHCGQTNAQGRQVCWNCKGWLVPQPVQVVQAPYVLQPEVSGCLSFTAVIFWLIFAFILVGMGVGAWFFLFH